MSMYSSLLLELRGEGGGHLLPRRVARDLEDLAAEQHGLAHLLRLLRVRQPLELLAL